MQGQSHKGGKDEDRAMLPCGDKGLSAQEETASLDISLEQEVQTHQVGGLDTLWETVAPAWSLFSYDIQSYQKRNCTCTTTMESLRKW